MPYQTIGDLPADQTDQYSPDQKKRFLAVFNAVHKHTGGAEGRAFAAAHAAAKKHGYRRKEKAHENRLHKMTTGYKAGWEDKTPGPDSEKPWSGNDNG